MREQALTSSPRASAGLTLISTLIMALSSSSASAIPAEFKKPAAIVPNVAFWKKVYGDWSINDIALHDEEDLGIVYRVVKVPIRGAKNDKGQTRAEAINSARAEVETALKSLQKKQPKDESKLEGMEKQVFLALKSSARPDKYARLAKIRGQNGLRERFIQGYQLSGLYQTFIEAELQRNGLPKELIGVAFVESLFYTGARSKVGAAGIWQFMSYTGREYMQLNAVLDERWDPIIATESAAKYLKTAKRELSGEWPLAITSYNYGRGGMRGLARDAGSNDFGVILAVSKGKRFGFAARNYYASFLAVLEVLEEAPTRFAGIQKKAPWSYDVVRTPFPLYCTQLTATGLVDQASLEVLNPALTDDAARGKLPLPHGISLRVPRGKGKELMAKLEALPAADKRRGMLAVKSVHTCTGKQSMIEIAKKYSMSPDILAARTGVPVDAVPAKGQKLPIPPAAAKYTLFPEARGMPLPPLSEAPPLLLADAATLLPDLADDDDAPAMPLKPKAPVVRRPEGPVALTGVVKVTGVRSEALARALPAVDVVAGAPDEPFPLIDVLVGTAPPVDREREPEPDVVSLTPPIS
ncbi:MAG: lytic transglycosylase domain-containing protein [Deltaproteobacteria bacterium]|nr:lytic transglycosylase domain-containing protein [Deltaproteobacteria bacterium]